MQKESLHQAKGYISRNKRRRILNRIVAVLACAVVFVTVYMLILPAITMEQPAHCGMEEHTHSASCFERQLICGLEESAHIHSEECYSEESVPVCGIDGADGSHTHTEECYAAQKIRICGYDEVSTGHLHTDDCFGDVLICQNEEHEHTLACFSDPDADVETQEVWEQTLSGVALTGVWADDVLAVARSQLGYVESTRNYTVTEEGELKGYSRYGAWYGDPYGDWCAMFVSFCLHYAGVEGYPLDANCVNWIKQLEDPQYDSYFRSDTYFPRPGDLIFFNIDSDGSADHVGIIAEIIEKTDTEPTKVKTIEGNSAGRVQYVTYELNNPIILGYGKLPANPNPVNAEEQFILADVTAGGQYLTLTGPVSSLPFPAKEITITAETVVNEDVAALVGEAVADTELENGQVYLFDIRLWHDGEEIEPVGPVSLSISGVADTVEDQHAKVFHIDEENGRTTDMNAEIQEDGGTAFDTDHFSLYSIVLPAANGLIEVFSSMDTVWDAESMTVSSLNFTASNNGVDNVYYSVQYSDDGGSSWTTAV